MKIYCMICKIDCGEIKDAKLRKEISFLCKKCTSIIKLKINKNSSSNNEVNFLRDMFNMKG